ncbi:diadenylate cyclase CdaA [Armatimonas rosea]|uniref:Diadenylate cyclase n=1 Tax=Armatimonas rosea TaxID=685828 RepID=A0A7W9SRS7_ARMRO|nr:diadenylate cyclase CdaA [Armatimonas rosea]MBB6051656.1 diadenylate cyclase [Armatimonas rosea]
MSALLASIRSIDFKSLALAALDIIVVAYILYRLIVLAKGRRAWQILIGIGVFFLLVLLSNWLGLVTLNWLLQSITPLGPVAIVILLYPELREVLERLGRLDFWGAPLSVTRQENITGTIEAIVTAATLLSARKTGALILMARETGLDDVIATGTVLNATVTPELLTTIFYSGTALHDGAVIVRDGFLVAAGCTLPLSDAPNIATNVHMRHRAAMGASESSDAVVVIVSEETGTISIAIGGKLDRGLKPELLREKLLSAFGKGAKKALPRLSLTRKNKEASSEAPTS